MAKDKAGVSDKLNIGIQRGDKDLDPEIDDAVVQQVAALAGAVKKVAGRIMGVDPERVEVVIREVPGADKND